MKPYRTSLSARIISAAVAFALIGGGAIPLLGLTPAIAIPIVLLAAAGGGIVGLLFGTHDHPGPSVVLAIALPLALWPYTMVLMGITKYFPSLGWLLVAGGTVVAGASAIASYTTKPDPARAPAPAPASQQH